MQGYNYTIPFSNYAYTNGTYCQLQVTQTFLEDYYIGVPFFSTFYTEFIGYSTWSDYSINIGLSANAPSAASLTVSAYIPPSPTPTPTPTPDSSSLQIWEIVVIAVAGTVFLALIVFTTYFFCQKKVDHTDASHMIKGHGVEDWSEGQKTTAINE